MNMLPYDLRRDNASDCIREYPYTEQDNLDAGYCLDAPDMVPVGGVSSYFPPWYSCIRYGDRRDGQ